MNRDSLFEIENGINVNDLFVFYVVNNSNELNLINKQDGDFCFVKDQKRIFVNKNNEWIKMLDEKEIKKEIKKNILIRG